MYQIILKKNAFLQTNNIVYKNNRHGYKCTKCV